MVLTIGAEALPQRQGVRVAEETSAARGGQRWIPQGVQLGRSGLSDSFAELSYIWSPLQMYDGRETV